MEELVIWGAGAIGGAIGAALAHADTDPLLVVLGIQAKAIRL